MDTPGIYNEQVRELRKLPNEQLCLRHGIFYKTINCSTCVTEKTLVCEVIKNGNELFNVVRHRPK